MYRGVRFSKGVVIRMIKSPKKSTIAFFIVFCILLISSVPVFAYVTIGSGYVSKTIPIEHRTLTYHTPFINSISAWNSCGAGVNIYTVPGSGNNWIIDEQIADTWYGMYQAKRLKYIFWGRATKFKITLNRTTLVSKTNNFRQSVIVHELGHALCLGDNPPESPSIMRYDRNRETCITPQQDDINGVNANY